MMQKKQAGIMEGISVAIPPDSPLANLTSGKDTTAPGERTLADIEAGPGSGRHVNTSTENLIKDLNAPDVFHSVPRSEVPQLTPHGGQTVEQSWDSFIEAHPEVVQYLDKHLDKASGLHLPETKNPDNAFLKMSQLADLALSGDEKAKQEIDTLANTQINLPGMTDTPLLKLYAQWEKQLHPEL